MSSWPKHVVLEFIELFKTLEPLWLIKSKDYYNKNKRNECYDELLSVVLMFEPSANRETITKKINNLRSSFRKEHKKVIASMLSGAPADEVYTPKLWYYKDLLFLKDQEETLPSTSSIDANEESLSTEESNAESITPESFNTLRRQSSLTSSSRAFKRKHSSNNNSSGSQAILRMVGERLESICNEDEFDIIGKIVASKLRSLSPVQKIYAEKIINDALFEGQLNNLSRSSRLSNPLPNSGFANPANVNPVHIKTETIVHSHPAYQVEFEEQLPNLAEVSGVD